MNIRIRPVFLAALALALVLGGTAAVAHDDVLVIAISGDIETLDPPFSRFSARTRPT